MTRNLRYEVVYPQPLEKVWRVLTDSEAMAAWLMPNDFAPRVGHRFQFRTKPAPGFDGIVNCEVLELDAPHRVSYSWRGGGIDTVVTFTLAPERDGTKLVLEHAGFRGARPFFVSLILGAGWKKIIKLNIPNVMAQLDGGQRLQPQSDCN